MGIVREGCMAGITYIVSIYSKKAILWLAECRWVSAKASTFYNRRTILLYTFIVNIYRCRLDRFSLLYSDGVVPFHLRIVSSAK